MVLVFNFGSSSFKFKIFKSEDCSEVINGICERIGEDFGRVVFSLENGKKEERKVNFKTHREAFCEVKRIVFEDEDVFVRGKIRAIGHRVVHGGRYFSTLALINSETIKKIESLVPLAPMHNLANLDGIYGCLEAFPDVIQFAVFDTAFFYGLPQISYLYAIPLDLAEKHGIRKYGFHGISHKFMSEKYAEFKKSCDLKIITCHLGSGSSIAAINGSMPIDVSMGFTPLEGLMMGTRSGNIDPSVVSFLAKKENISIFDVENLLNKKSGVLGISGVSADMRDIVENRKSNARCRLAFEMFCYRIIKFIGAYIAVLGGCDGIVFSAGIGENFPVIRKKICNALSFFGVKIDDLAKEKNDGIISAPDSKIDVMVVKLNEELCIARSILNSVVF